MALLQPLLAARMASVLANPSDVSAAKAQEWASAYTTYAATAQAGVLFPVFVGIEGQAMAGVLARAMANPNNTAVQFAMAVANAVETFWLLPPVLFSAGVAAGAVTSFIGKPILITTLTGVFSTEYREVASVANAIATALDVATRTVTVTFAPPPGSTATLV